MIMPLKVIKTIATFLIVLIMLGVLLGLAILFSPIWVPTAVLIGARRKRQSRQIRREWLANGKYILFVTSNSPVWQDYISKKILPRIEKHAIVINWSERKKWDWKNSLEIQTFSRYLGTHREFCPAAIVFLPGQRPKVIRFWQAFKDYKHGNHQLLKQCEANLFDGLAAALK